MFELFENIKDFFQSMYDSTIGFFVDFFSSLAGFVSSAYDMFLFLALFVIAFLIFRFFKYITLPAIILGQIVMLTGTITFMLTMVAFMTTALVSIYNRIFALAEYINTASSSVSCLGYMFDCMGISNTFSYFYTELFSLFIVALILRLSGLFFWAFGILSDRVWKLGVLLGLV